MALATLHTTLYPHSIPIEVLRQRYLWGVPCESVRFTSIKLELISQIPQQNDAAAKMEHPEKVLSISFITDN